MDTKVTPLRPESNVRITYDKDGVTITKPGPQRPFILYLTHDELPDVIEQLVEISQPWGGSAS